MSRASRALFIDVSVAGQPGTIATRVVAPDGTDSGPLSHHLSAATLLLMAERLFGHAPPTTLLTVSGTNFDHGEQLSPAVAAALPRLVHQALDSLRVVSHA